MIYGTDQGDWSADTLRLKADLHEVWVRDWKFLTTDSNMTSREVDGQFKGLKLPREIVKKIYCRNARRFLPGLLTYT
jgi:hypothetical protein